MQQLSGEPDRRYRQRLATLTNAVTAHLQTIGFEIGPDATGMAYIVTRGNRRVGGPCSKMEDAIASALRNWQVSGPHKSA